MRFPAGDRSEGTGQRDRTLGLRILGVSRRKKTEKGLDGPKQSRCTRRDSSRVSRVLADREGRTGSGFCQGVGRRSYIQLLFPLVRK